MAFVNIEWCWELARVMTSNILGFRFSILERYSDSNKWFVVRLEE